MACVGALFDGTTGTSPARRSLPLAQIAPPREQHVSVYAILPGQLGDGQARLASGTPFIGHGGVVGMVIPVLLWKPRTLYEFHHPLVAIVIATKPARIALGTGEAPQFPAGAKVVSE